MGGIAGVRLRDKAQGRPRLFRERTEAPFASVKKGFCCCLTLRDSLDSKL